MTVEEFMRYELPTADTFRQRLTEYLFLDGKDVEALAFPFNYCEENNGNEDIKSAYYRGIDLLKQLATILIELSNFYGAKAKKLAADFLELSRKADAYWNGKGDLSWKEIKETICDKSKEFARECFINVEPLDALAAIVARLDAAQLEAAARIIDEARSAKQEPPMIAQTLAAAEAARDAATANGATLAEVKAQGDRIDATTRATDGKVDALIGRGADNAVKPPRMAQLITAALKKVGNHKGVTRRTVENWVRRLKEGAPHGTQPPEGFTLNTLRTLEAAAEFAAKYADAEARRLRVGIAFNEHDSRLEEEARRRHADEQEARFKRLDG